MAYGRLMAACILVALGGLGVTHQAAPENPDAPAPQTLRILRGEASYDLDPHSSSSGGDAAVIIQIYEGLVRASASQPLKWEPALATSWKVSADNLEWTFTLKRGVKFHDGEAFNALAVKKSIDRMIIDDHPAKPAMRPYRDSYMETITEVEVMDDFTVKLHLSEPNPRLLATLGLHCCMIVSPKAIDHLATIRSPRERSEWLTRNPAGTGPYRWHKAGEFDGRNVRLNANDSYHDGGSVAAQVEFFTMTEVTAQRDALLAGEADLISSVDPAHRSALRDNPRVHLHEQPASNLSYLAMNCAEGSGRSTESLSIRRAIAHAIRRDQMTAICDGAATPQHTLLPANMFGHPAGYVPAGDELPEEEALQAARKLIDAHGAPDKPLLLLYPEVPRPYLTLPTATAALIKAQLEAVGLKVEPEAIPLSELNSRVESGDYDLVLIGWMGDTGEPDNFYSPLLGGRDGVPSGNNLSRFYSEDVVELISLARLETDIAKRAAHYAKLEKLVFEQHRPFVPLFSVSTAVAWSSSIEGVTVTSQGALRLVRPQ